VYWERPPYRMFFFCFCCSPGILKKEHALYDDGCFDFLKLHNFFSFFGILRNFPTRKDLFCSHPIFPPLSTPKIKLVIYKHNTKFYLLAFCFAHWCSKALVIKSLIKRINHKRFIDWSPVVIFCLVTEYMKKLKNKKWRFNWTYWHLTPPFWHKIYNLKKLTS
jgi:hypothetical protein